MAYDQAQKIAKYRNGRGNDPGKDPEQQSNTNPRPNGDEITLVHTVCTTEDPHVDGLETHMADNDTRNDNLRYQQ